MAQAGVPVLPWHRHSWRCSKEHRLSVLQENTVLPAAKVIPELVFNDLNQCQALWRECQR